MTNIDIKENLNEELNKTEIKKRGRKKQFDDETLKINRSESCKKYYETHKEALIKKTQELYQKDKSKAVKNSKKYYDTHKHKITLEKMKRKLEANEYNVKIQKKIEELKLKPLKGDVKKMLKYYQYKLDNDVYNNKLRAKIEELTNLNDLNTQGGLLHNASTYELLRLSQKNDKKGDFQI